MHYNIYILFIIYIHILKSNGENEKNVTIPSNENKDLTSEQNKTDNSVFGANQIVTSLVVPENLNISLSNNDTTKYFIKGIKTDAVFRGFYVVLGIGCIFLLYMAVKTLRLKRHRAINRYKIIATKSEDQESFFPLAADEGEDEEIFNASSNRQGYS
ncbi:hypothetical protein Anas_07814 [Armadillidium nasatum]|uniref:Uncharacterized protein n=1 Tax=Armadillidium nasatum TaxID=96803 RepID=A0A5N5SNI3_9CRUS|nr:hypothetical protein Anas_07814 [Armadillidium nasatum]